ncbi:MAG TPA: hypothetical protein VJL89_08020 [Thermodesulfovibrionia bacterium]|nr:hypothetical protein [Thermodesulfovibrionia bacterium]
MTVQDTETGLKFVQITAEKNTIYNAGDFLTTGYTQGQTTPFNFIVTKTVQGQSAMIAFAVKDMAGNLKICDPQVDTVSQKNGKKKIIFRNVPDAEKYLTIINNDPGFTKATVIVNRKNRFKITNLLPDEKQTIDISSAMKPGDENVVKVKAAGGTKGASTATIMISDNTKQSRDAALIIGTVSE